MFAIEVAQFEGGDAKAFVPRLFGHTEEARGAKSQGSRPKHTEDDFLADVAQKQQEGELTDREAAILRELHEFIKAEADDYKIGGTANVSITALWDCIGGSKGLFTINSGGIIEFWQARGNHGNPDTDWDHRAVEDWHDSLHRINPEEIPKDENARSFPVSALIEHEKLERFKTACREFIGRIQT